MNNKLIIKPFNALYLLFIACYSGLLLAAVYYLRTISVESVFNFGLYLALFQVVYFVGYRYLLINDKEYDEAVYEGKGVNIYNELPLFPCNIITLLMPIPFLFNPIAPIARPLLSYLFFGAFEGPLIALLMPSNGFEKYSILKPRVFIFYTYHINCMVFPLIFKFTGLYQPDVIGCFEGVGVFIILMTLAYFINDYLVKSKLNEKANYFFVYDYECNPIMEYLHSLIPYRYFFVFPLFPIFIILSLFLNFIFNL